jgi:preprotein translocase subunit SecD
MNVLLKSMQFVQSISFNFSIFNICSMKSIKYFILAIIFLGMLLPGFTHVRNYSNAQTLLLQALNSEVTTAQMNASRQILSKRLKSMNMSQIQVEQNTTENQLILKIRGEVNMEHLKGLLLAPGRVNFYPVLSRREVLVLLTKQPSAECTRITFQKLNLDESENFHSPFLLGMAVAADTAVVNRCLCSPEVRERFTGNKKFLWSRYSDESGQFDLQVVNTTENGITEGSIREAKAFSTGEENNGISLVFKKNDWESWRKLTAENLDKVVAIVIDNKVYSAPMVRAEIASGKAQITGSFSREEAEQLAAVISNGALPVNFEIK